MGSPLNSTATTSYLPAIESEEFWLAFRCRNWDRVQDHLKQGSHSYIRLGFDRLLTILADLEQSFGRSSGFDVLDVGCNTGLFSVGLAAVGNHVVGIDVDVSQCPKPRGDSDTFGNHNWNSASPSPQFYESDIRSFLKDDGRRWDVILLLNVVHHWQTRKDYAQSAPFTTIEFDEVMDRLASSFNFAIYYERPEVEPGFSSGQFNFEKYLGQGIAPRLVCPTLGPNGFARRLYRLERY